MAEKYLTEAFQALNILNEDTFDVDANGIAELTDFVNDETADMETIIDPLAQTEEELQDSYIGKAILDCVICQSKIYKDPEEVIISEDGSLANIGEICPYCQSSDGYKVIGQVAEYCPHCDDEDVKVETDDTTITVDVDKKEDEELNESMENVTIETDKEKIKVTSEPKEEEVEEIKSEEEVIAPVSDEIEDQFKSENEEDEYEDVDIDEFEEEDFDELGEKYLRRVYENVKSYKTTSGSVKENLLKLEGLITFKSGKQAKTNFIFEAKSKSKDGKLKFLGENKQFARGRQSFTLTGTANKGKFLAESFTYNYRAKNPSTNKSQRLYGTVRKSK